MRVRGAIWCWALALAGSHCTVLEYDKMDGTHWPGSYEEGGVTHDLESIWASASQALVVDEDDADLEIGVLLSGDLAYGITDPDYLSAVQALDMARANRSSPVGPSQVLWFWEIHHVQGLVLDSWYYNTTTSTKDEFVLGVMPDTSDRSTFVNFYRNPSISSHAKKYLHSAAHELGHAFNLNHGDSDRSIMTDTTTWIWTGEFLFSGSSLDHFDTHDPDAVHPGMGPYHTSHSDH